MAETKTDKIEREYVIPLRHRWQIVPRYQRTNKAVRAVREFLVRHMKVRDRDMDKIKVDKYLNEVLWNRGIKNPPSKIKVKAIKEGDIVRVELAELSDKIKFKKLREEKIEKSAKEVAKKKKKETAEEINKEEVSEEKQKETEEKKEATIEAEQKIEKTEAKEMKHTTKVKSPKEEKNMKTGDYNKSSRGH